MPLNSFYGAALCSCDVTNDGGDDLLVGAPLFAQSTGKDIAIEEGIVIVYIGVGYLVWKSTDVAVNAPPHPFFVRTILHALSIR